MSYLLLTALFACSESTAEKPEDTSSAVPEPTSDYPVLDTGEAPEPVPFSGQIQLADGAVLDASSLRVQMCAEYCFPTQIDAEGNFSYTNLVPALYSFDVVPLNDYAGVLATSMDFIQLSAEEGAKALSAPVMLYAFEESVAVPPCDPAAGEACSAPLELSGLTVQVEFDKFEQEEDVELYVAGVSVPVEGSGLTFETLTTNPFAMWYLGMFDTEVELDVTFSGLTAGETIQVYNSVYATHSWDLISEGVVNEDGELSATLTHLSALALVRP